MREIFTEIDIDAPADRVWCVLVDIQMWHEWNPFIPDISGEISVGSRLTIRVEPPGGKPMSFKPIVSCVQENSDLIWIGSLPIPGAFKGEHIFELRPIDDAHTKLIQRENYSGWMIPFLWKSLDRNVRAGFQLMNEALKNEAEKPG